MTDAFDVRTTPRFERELRRLVRRHPELTELYARAISTLEHDPLNRTREHDIKKLESVSQGEGQWRLRLRRFRFRYDLYGRIVVLQYAALRDEHTY